MKVYKDLHTHSKYSKWNHGKNTIEELVKVAIEKKLEVIAISDHAPGHPFGVRKKLLEKRRNEILKLREKYPQIKILVGLEANLVSKNGDIDVDSKLRQNLDICLMGFHRAGFGGFWNMLKFGLWKSLFGKNQIKSNTTAYINAIEKNNIDIIAHLQQYIKVDVGKVAAAAQKKGVLIEINNRHLKFTKDDVKAMLKTGCKFIISSDAHRKNSVGEFENAIKFVVDNQIPIENIVNVKE